MKLLSVAGLAAMLAALLGPWATRSFSANPGVIAVQLTAVLLMIWARVTLVRLFCEEHLLIRQDPECREHAASTRRLLPGVW